jgi:glycosyltransferase involved in cell wall biosynthesis
MPFISGVINIRNEEERLQTCLQSMKQLCDELIVVDMMSTDRSAEIAAEAGARVFSHPEVGYADPAREFALSKVEGEWILLLDADEILPAHVAQRLREIATEDTADVIRIPFLNYVCGKPMMGTAWAPSVSSHTRFFKNGMIKATGEVHNYLHPLPEARSILLPQTHCIHHFAYSSLEEVIAKANRYTSLQAPDEAYATRNSRPLKMMARFIRTFVKQYFKLRGHRDGWRGVAVSYSLAINHLIFDLKVIENRELGNADVKEQYARLAAELLSDEPSASELRV